MKSEIGSFIGLDLRNTGELFMGERNIARLNSARAGIYHSCRLYNCNSIYIPFYLCPTVKKFLLDHGITVKQYYIDKSFEPLNLNQQEKHAVLLVNYFGILSNRKITEMASRFNNVIIDNSAGFFSSPIEGCLNVYSPRKFFGVPDGCYVIGNNADTLVYDYEQDFSSSTASFLFKRVEFSTSETYIERMKNEERINNSDILKMSQLTRSLLSNIDYSDIKNRRYNNFQYAHSLFSALNRIDPTISLDSNCIPMVYPLIIEKMDLSDILKKNQIYTGRWWNGVLAEVSHATFESWISKYMMPIPIDQRYDINTLDYLCKILINSLDL